MQASHREFESYLDKRRFGSLDGLRFICIAAVIWHHSPAFGQLVDPAMILKRGFVGVHFFFVLSGFLITTLLLREEARTGQISILSFYRRRALRIIPVYFLVVTALGSYYILWKGETRYTELLPYYYLFLSNFLKGDIPNLAITWSLAVEEQYYLFWPVFLLFFKNPVVRVVGLLCLIIGCLVAALGAWATLGLEPIETKNAVWKLPVAGYSAILIGALTAFVLNNSRGFSVAYALLGSQWAAPVAFAALVLYLQLAPGNLTGFPNLGMHVLMAAALVSIVARENHSLQGILTWRPIERVGQISYGLYLYHLIALHFAGVLVSAVLPQAQFAAVIVTVIYIVLSVAVSEISFRTFESYFLGLKDRGSTTKTAHS